MPILPPQGMPIWEARSPSLRRQRSEGNRTTWAVSGPKDGRLPKWPEGRFPRKSVSVFRRLPPPGLGFKDREFECLRKAFQVRKRGEVANLPLAGQKLSKRVVPSGSPTQGAKGVAPSRG